ncbi:MAG: ArsR/SmtB family transcription factor [Xanthobacteraceae bacterium]
MAVPRTAPRTKKIKVSPDLDQMLERAHDASEFLKALAHKSRLLMLCVLSEGEKSVGELEEFLDERQSSVSAQLARLRLDGLVTARRDGKTVYYSLATEEVRTVLTTLYDVFCPGKKPRRH